VLLEFQVLRNGIIGMWPGVLTIRFGKVASTYDPSRNCQ
jgi:hypothetical protein